MHRYCRDKCHYWVGMYLLAENVFSPCLRLRLRNSISARLTASIAAETLSCFRHGASLTFAQSADGCLQVPGAGTTAHHVHLSCLFIFSRSSFWTVSGWLHFESHSCQLFGECTSRQTPDLPNCAVWKN